MRTFKLQVNEDELKALILHNKECLYNDMTPERCARIHDLIKRLNRETPEIEIEKTIENGPIDKAKEAWT